MKNIVIALCSMLLLLTAACLISFVLGTTAAVAPPEQRVPNALAIADPLCSHGPEEFCSHLPLVIISTEGQVVQKEEVVWIEVSVIDSQKGNNHVGDAPSFTTASTIKYRGNSSYFAFDKKQYRLEFYKGRLGTEKNNISVMGMAKECDWILYGPFLDRTLIRNKLIYGVSQQVMEWAPDTRYCEVFVDGNYQGIYLMTESVKVSKNRINLNSFGLLSGETPYLVQREGFGRETNPIKSFGAIAEKTQHELSINYPVPSRLLDTQREWIRNDISKLERVLYSDNFSDPITGYPAYIDIDSFVDYYIINEFSMLRGAGFLSTYMYKNLHGKLKITVWDFNNAFNLYQERLEFTHAFAVCENNWFACLFKDRTFTQKVVNRYHALRQGVLSDEYLLGAIDREVAYLGDAIDRNFQVWGYTFHESLLCKDEQGLRRDPKSYEEALVQLKKCIIERGAFLDAHIEALYQYAVN